MRRVFLIVLCLGLVASTASAGQKAAGPRYQCGSKSITIYFWPQGHNALPTLNSGAFKTPHLEVYVGTKAVAFADAAGNMAFSKTCKKTSDQAAHWPNKKHKSITTTQSVSCSFPAAPELKASKGAFSVIAAHTQLAVSVALKATGSALVYDTAHCKVKPAPPQATPMQYSFTGLTASFNLNPQAGVSIPVSYALSGQACGDPATALWKISVTLQGNPNGTATTPLPDATPENVQAITAKDQSGAETAKAQIQLTFAKGPPPTMAIGVVPTGGVSNIQTSAPVAVTATPVASC